MNTRRIPFQFSSTDPLVRQKELEKRFGLQPTCQKMYVDVNNPLSMGTPKETSSPRLQHRVPIFAEGYNHPVYSSSVDSMSSVPDKKPNVRVIPIEIEGADNRSPRHRNYSGPAGMAKDRCSDLAPERDGASPFKRFHFEDSSKSQSQKLNTEPKVFNIPITVEGVNDISRNSKVNAIPKFKNVAPSANGCSQSKSSSKVKSFEKDIKVQREPSQSQANQPKSDVEILLGKINDVLTEFKTYEAGVVEFNGTSKDKQYRYLDEMLTRCMLRLDDIDTMGNEEVRLARKSAVKKIQASIDLLESKATVDTSNEIPKVQSTSVENSVDNNNDSVVEMHDNQEKGNAVDSVESETSEEVEMDVTADDSRPETLDKVITNETNKGENNVEVEMSENEAINSSKITDKAEDVVQNENKPENNSVTEIEMSEEISPAEVHSTNSVLLPDTLSADKSEALDNITNDVDMLTEKVVSNVDEKSQSKIAQEQNENKLTEVEMVEIEDVSSKDCGEKIESQAIEKTDHIPDSSVQKTSPASPIDAEMKDVPDALEAGDKCVAD